LKPARRAFLFIGANDAISWQGLAGLYKRRDLPAAEAYLADLAAHGVTILRLMLEYCQDDKHYFERPVGTLDPVMVQLWDDLFGLCERYGLRVLLAPWDNFWMSRRWRQHPYNARNGGPASSPAAFFGDPATLDATIKRLGFVIERWGGSGVLAAWDLFNEIDPFWGGDVPQQSEVLGQLGAAIRRLEHERWGFTRPQTVSIFGPEPQGEYIDLIFRHRDLDFATTHIYAKDSIDHPANTVLPALTMARWVRFGLKHTPPDRPFTDSEHGPIHLFNDHGRCWRRLLTMNTSAI
jgi:mannan endo-1,4-beta-mannosidase